MMERKQEKGRRWSVKEWLLCRSRLSANYTIFSDMRTDLPEDYKKYLRMDAESFDYIPKVVSPIISKQELQDARLINYC